MSRIILCGASSVGKTTLSNDWCSRNAEYTQIQEVARDVMLELGISREDMTESLKTDKKEVFFHFQESIFKEQNKREAELTEKKLRFISDRGPDPLVYTFLQDEQVAYELFEQAAVKECFSLYRRSLVVLLCPLDNTSDDGVRLVQSRTEQDDFTVALRRVLFQCNVPYMCIEEKDRGKRVDILKKAVEGHFLMGMKQFFKSLYLSFYMDRDLEKKEFFDAPYLPTPKPVKLAMVRTFEINENEIILTRKNMDEYQQSNRIVDRYGEEEFVLIQFHKKLPDQLIVDILHRGVFVNGEEYQFLGCSSSGLKERKCYLLRGDVARVDSVLEECGNFETIKKVSNRHKRIGLLFSAGIKTTVIPDKVEEIGDIERNGYNFTDGCGNISVSLAKKLAVESNGTVISPEDTIPTVFQIRYQGSKGVVIKDPQLKGDTIQLRDSMRKFQPGTKPFEEIWVCKSSRPNSYGSLNKQYMMLLSGLGISDEVFLEKQNQYFNVLENMLVKPVFAIKILDWQNFPDLAVSVAACSSSEELKQNTAVQSKLRYVRYKMIEKLDKLSIPIIKSRTVFGVCDPLSLLEYGECFLRFSFKGAPHTLEAGTLVVVAKNPCYFLGDIRVLTAADYPELNHLVDCIVYPVKGNRPHSTEIAGSDLDGDEYFVCWDEKLIPPHIGKPYSFPSVEAHPSDKVTRAMMLDYFSSFVNSVGKIATYFQHWADTIGPGCKQCEELGAWFSRSVDAAKTGDVVRIPRYLTPPRSVPNPTPSETPEKVWVTMQRLAKEEREKLNEDIADNALSNEESLFEISEEFIRTLLENTDRAMSEYKAFCLLYKWCGIQKFTETERRDKLIELSDYINFGMMAMNERVEAVQLGIPAARVMNALNKSKLLDREMLRHFSLDLPSCGWKFYIREKSADFNWPHLFRAIKGYTESLLILQLRDEYIEYRLAFHFNGEFEEGESVAPGGSLTCYFYSPHFGYQLRYVTECEYNFTLTQDVIQVYKGDLKQTFLWLKSQVWEKESQILEYDRVSIDLNRFQSSRIRTDQHPRIRKMNFCAVEVFVKNTRLEEIAYYDVHETEQTDDMYSGEEDPDVVLEDLPSEDEEEREPSTVVPDTPLKALKEFARIGDCKKFCEALELIPEETPRSNIIEEFLSLLSTLVVQYSHKTSTELLKSAAAPDKASGPTIEEEWPKLETEEGVEDTPAFSQTAEPDFLQLTDAERNKNLAKKISYLEKILNSPIIDFSSPRALVQLYDNLSKLHLYELIKSHLNKSIGQIKMSTIAQYFDCVFNWDWWTFLPLSIACQLSNKLYLLVLELDSLHAQDSSQAGETELTSIKDLSTSTGELPPIDQWQLNLYKCYFAHLIHKHLLIESPSTADSAKVADTEKSLCLLKVTPSERETPASEQTSSSDEERTGVTTNTKAKKKGKEKDKAWKACFSRTEAVRSSDFSIGTHVKIRFMPTPDSYHSRDPVAIGCISFSSSSPVSIVVDIPEPVPLCIKRSAKLMKGFWSLSLIGNVTSFKRSRKALEGLFAPGIVSILVSPEGFPPKELKQEDKLDPSGEPPEPVQERERIPNPYEVHTECKACENRADFNDSQEMAIRAALKQRLTLIHGPPGTGKTFVASEIVHQMCHIIRQGEESEEKLKILVAAETNNAVDNLTRKLLHLDMLVIRIGKKNAISKDLHEHSLEHQVEMKRVEQREKKKGQFQSPKLKKEILNSADIIATTCTGAGDADLRGIKFDFILIDEATQAVEPISLISIVKSCQKLVLIGDPKQLAPTITEEPNLQTEEGVPPLKEALCTTIFHRLHTKVDPIFLDEQHRMHPAIAEFPSRVFYSGKLKTAVKAEDRVPPNVKFINPKEPITFINVDYKEFKSGTSRKNPGEAKVVVKVVKQLMATNEYKVSDIGIITPYAAQVKCIRDSLENIKVDVHSIDSFQGREKEIIVFSMVRNFETGEASFLKDNCRINVLLTRAKRALIGIGNRDTIRHSEVWADWTYRYSISEEEFNEKIQSQGDRGEQGDMNRDQGGGYQRGGRDSQNNYRNRDRDRDQQYRHFSTEQTINFDSPKKKVPQRERKYRGWETAITDCNNGPVEGGGEDESTDKS